MLERGMARVAADAELAQQAQHDRQIRVARDLVVRCERLLHALTCQTPVSTSSLHLLREALAEAHAVGLT